MSIPQRFYSYENPISFEDSVILFSPLNHIDLELKLRQSNISLRLLFILLSKIGMPATPIVGDRHLMIKTGHTGANNRVNAFLTLQMISDGLVIHVPKSYTSPISNTWKPEIKIQNKYQQFSEIFDVISEYNSSSDIIEKYLKLYQVVEDYMYKSALVKLEREKNGQIFSLRDFKRMNEDISKKEIVVLKEFITDVFAINLAPGTSIKADCLAQWVALPPFLPVNNINTVISQYKILEGDSQ